MHVSICGSCFCVCEYQKEMGPEARITHLNGKKFLSPVSHQEKPNKELMLGTVTLPVPAQVALAQFLYANTDLAKHLK